MAVTDGSFICKLYPNLCSTAFVMECAKGWGCLIGSFLEALLVVNAHRGKLLGFMAILVILLSIDRMHCDLSLSIGLKRFAHLPPYRIPLCCQDSDILKNILVNF